jgi:PhzF family phenazine biosynthesis protein
MLASEQLFARADVHQYMTRKLRIFQVDAFTDTRFAGNPAGVVLDADTLTDTEMQAIARELNNGDTAFLFAPNAADHDLRIRFFTPRKEAPFVGHATLAAHAVLARIAPQTRRKQSGKTGLVEVHTLPNDAGFAIRQTPPPLGRQITASELRETLALLGLSHEQVDDTCPARIVGAASTRLLLAVKDGAALDAMAPQLAALGVLSGEMGAQGYFIYARTSRVAGCDTEARMFCPALGIDEDPVSGNAHAMLGIHLHALGLLPTDAGRGRFIGAQGGHVGRPGRVTVEVELDATGAAIAASISGQAVIVFEAQLTI